MALAQFLFTCIDKSSRDSIKNSLSNEQDGIELIVHLHKQYGTSNITDAYKAKENLESTSWQTSDTIDMFNSRSMKRLAIYHTTLSTANNTKHINKIGTNELVQLYLTRLVTTMPNTTACLQEFVMSLSQCSHTSTMTLRYIPQSPS
jgi:hypothetical protein